MKFEPIGRIIKTTSSAFNLAAKKYFLTRKYKNPNAISDQESFLLKHIYWARNTAIGKKYNFKKIKSIQDWHNNFPILTHDDHRSYIELCMMWYRDILIPGKIPLFAKTAGTTSEYTKYVPVTQKALNINHYRWGKDILSRYCYNNPDTKLFSGKSIVVGGNFDTNPRNSALQNCGYISAILQQKSPYIWQFMREPNGWIEFVSSREEKLDYIINRCKDKNITSMWWLVSWSIMILEEIIKQTWAKDIYEIRPNFELYISGGMKFEPYRKRFEQLFPGGKTNFYQSYNTSEGFIAVQIDNTDTSMLLLTNHGMYFEFVETSKRFESDNISDIDKNDILTLWQVEKDKEYILLITTVAGLWRYPIGDTVKFTNLDPYKIQITGRIKYRMDIFDERLTEDEVQSAIDKTCEELDCIVDNWTLGSRRVSESSGEHIYIIEFIKYPTHEEKFAKLLDENVQKANGDYEYVRQWDKFLLPPKVKIVPKGSFYEWLKWKWKLGWQNKVPKIYNWDKIINDFMK